MILYKSNNILQRSFFVDKRIERINFLAKKQKETGLTEEEKAEQKKLREEYLAAFRASFRRQLENTDIKYDDGSVVPFTEYAKRKKQ